MSLTIGRSSRSNWRFNTSKIVFFCKMNRFFTLRVWLPGLYSTHGRVVVWKVHVRRWKGWFAGEKADSRVKMLVWVFGQVIGQVGREPCGGRIPGHIRYVIHPDQIFCKARSTAWYDARFTTVNKARSTVTSDVKSTLTIFIAVNADRLLPAMQILLLPAYSDRSKIVGEVIVNMSKQ